PVDDEVVLDDVLGAWGNDRSEVFGLTAVDLRMGITDLPDNGCEKGMAATVRAADDPDAFEMLAAVFTTAEPILRLLLGTKDALMEFFELEEAPRAFEVEADAAAEMAGDLVEGIAEGLETMVAFELFAFEERSVTESTSVEGLVAGLAGMLAFVDTFAFEEPSVVESARSEGFATSEEGVVADVEPLPVLDDVEEVEPLAAAEMAFDSVVDPETPALTEMDALEWAEALCNL
ncbi:hypothetical protein V5O48_019430, partial [Marasmius crinis-equi]